MENAKAYDSFQHELQDYIRKQRAMGLQPEVCFRKVREDSVHRERDHTAPRSPMLEQRLPFRRSHESPGSYKRPRTVESHLPPVSNVHHFRQRWEPLNHCQKKHDHFFNNWWRPSQGMTTGCHLARYTEDASCLSEDHTCVHLAGDQDRGWERRSREKGGAGDGKEEHVGWKRKYHEDEDSHKENRRKTRMEPGSAEKSKHRKKSSHDRDITEEGRRSSREKRHPGRESSQEWDLWDEAILGGCY